MHSVYAWHRRARFIKNSTFPFPSFATIILYDYYPQYKKKTKNKITLQCYPIYIGGGVDFSEAVKRRRIATFGRFIGDPLGRKWRIYSYAHQAWHDIHVCLLLWRSVLDGAKKKKKNLNKPHQMWKKVNNTWGDICARDEPFKSRRMRAGYSHLFIVAEQTNSDRSTFH